MEKFKVDEGGEMQKVENLDDDITQDQDTDLEEDLDLDDGPEGEGLEDEDSDDSEGSDDLPAWMNEEDGDDGGDASTGDQVPVAKHVDLKKKLQGKVSERDEEIARLQAENEALKSGSVPPQQQQLQEPTLPRRSDFDDEEAFDKAYAQYNRDVVKYDAEVERRQSEQASKVEARQQKVAQAVDDHYDRASKLVEQHGIKPELYTQAEEKVKDIIESVLPKGRDAIYNEYLNIIGEGSEKVMLHIGRNKAASAEFERLLREDPTGLRASMFLGMKKREISGTKNLSSQAPAPANRLRGDASNSSKADAAKRKYQAHHKKGNTQAAFNIKQQAKKAGIDVSTW